MVVITPAAARAAALVLCVASAACSSSGSKDGPFNFAGTWEGVLVAGPEPTRSAVFLTQRGDAVTGSISVDAALLGKADGATLSFTLDFGGVCGAAAAGSASVERLADRDRLHLAYQGTSTCSGPIGAAGSFDRMRCPAPTSACSAGYAEVDPRPYCVDLTRDAGNCGMCGLRCGGDLQVCVSGSCQVPACSGPVPLEAPRTFLAASTLWSLVLADVDRDGAPDAIASGATLSAGVDSVVVVLRNDATGGFSSRTATSLSSLFAGAPVDIPSAVAAGDLDGDGRLDVAAYVGALPYPDTLTSEGEVLTLLGNGDGSFRAGERLPTGPDDSLMDLGPRVIAVADLNGDGVDDVAARSGLARAVQVRLGRRGGALGPKVEYAVADAVEAIAAADLDRDGIVDLAVASYDTSDPHSVRQVVSVLLGSGDGTFRAPVESPGVPSPHDLAVADLDEDGVPDLVVIGWWSWASHDASVLLGNGDGTFQAPVAVEQEPMSFAWSVAVADLDGDGHQDLAVGDATRGLELFLGRGDGTFAAFEQPVAGGAGLVTAADLDGDGRTDVLLGDPGGRDDVGVYRACSP